MEIPIDEEVRVQNGLPDACGATIAAKKYTGIDSIWQEEYASGGYYVPVVLSSA
jgi:hypothetical protein